MEKAPDTEKKTNKALINKVKAQFKQDKKLDILYGTSDAFMFYNKAQAQNHIETNQLKEKEVKKFNRINYES